MLENINDIISQGDINLADLNKRIWNTEGLVRKLPVTERNYVNIERKYNLDSETYTFLLEKITEAEIAKASNVSDSQIIEEAHYHAQIAPKSSTVYAMYLSLGIIIPLLFIFLLDFFRTRVNSQEDVENLTNLPVLGHIFVNQTGKDRDTTVLDNPSGKDSEPFRGLRNKLNLMTRGKEKPVIAITSTAPKEGKSYTAINLAASFALLNKKALLLDLDLRNSAISSVFGIDPNMGVVNYIIGEANASEITFNIKHPDFHVIPAGPIPPNPGEMLMDKKLLQLLNNLKMEYDVIVVDAAPVGFVSDLFQITEMLDATLFVVRDRVTKRSWLKNAIQELQDHNLKSVGIVINGLKRKKNKYKSYGYGYGYGYGAKSGKKKNKRKKLA
jgi:capsular exopolysaccharide synthesis family protein